MQHRQKVSARSLRSSRDFVRARGWDDPNYVGDLLSIIDRVMRLMGLAGATPRVSVETATDTIPAEKLVGWRRWLRETQFVPESALDDDLRALCRKLSEPPTAETTAMIGPPADSPLWHDDERGAKLKLLELAGAAETQLHRRLVPRPTRGSAAALRRAVIPTFPTC